MQQEKDVGTEAPDWSKAKKKQLLQTLLPALEENRRLRDSVSRLTKLSARPPVFRHHGREDDFVPAGWVDQHGIDIPRADGVFDSPTAWVRIKYGTIIGAGLKNQSILSLMVSLDLLDQGAERHGSLYRDWKAAFLSRLDRGTSGGKGSDDPDAWSKEDRYSKLLQRVDQDYLSAMDGIVASRPRARHLAAFQDNQAAFVEAFKTVARAMTAVSRDADEALKAVRGQ